jgi:putative oxidoreductase
MRHIVITSKILRPILNVLDLFRSLGDFIARYWIAKIFFSSGLSKIQDWNTTIVLFKDIYSVPLMNPVLAAYIGTGVELILPVFLVFGLGGRMLLFLFFIYNIICATSFHFLWTPLGATGLDDHITWGILLMMLMFHGMGRFSVDYLLRRKYGHLLIMKG